jgi:PII-like signaling protein
MKDLITIRIYFEYGQKIKNHSFWKRMYSSDFTVELIKRAKASGLHQVLHLNVNKGYLNSQKISWGTSEIKSYKNPHLIEITDAEFKVNQFLEEQKNLLQETQVLIVKNEILIKT